VSSLKVVRLPVFKVIIPCGSMGANYYIVRGEIFEGREVIVFFRGTYGYAGAGPHQSAFVENSSSSLNTPYKRDAVTISYPCSA